MLFRSQIRPPFLQNYVDQDEEEREIERLGENHVKLIGSDSEDDVFLTEEEQSFFSLEKNENAYEDSEEYRLGFENAIMEVHKQYDLRNKGSLDNSKDKNTSTAVRKNVENQPKKTTEKPNILAKKIDLNKEKSS